MRVVRFPRGKRRHFTADCRTSLCGRQLKAPILEPDERPDCLRCLEIEFEIEGGN